MLTKTITALVAALVLATSLVSGANAQSQHAVQPFTQAERNWFQIPQGHDDGMPRR